MPTDTSPAKALLLALHSINPMARALLVVLAVLGIFSAAFAVNDVVVYNLKLFVEGKEFVIKGFNYQPAPVHSSEYLVARRSLPALSDWLSLQDWPVLASPAAVARPGRLCLLRL